MTNYANLPAPSPEAGLSRYLQEIRKFPMLEPEEEYMLARRWADEQDPEAAHKLVTSHLRLAAKIAMGYRGYGLPQAEVISEANVGLMQAVKRFDPEKGFRLATYAMWWIRASIQEYILRSWSLVKMGTTSAQKKLFFNLRKAKARIAGGRAAAPPASGGMQQTKLGAPATPGPRDTRVGAGGDTCSRSRPCTTAAPRAAAGAGSAEAAVEEAVEGAVTVAAAALARRCSSWAYSTYCQSFGHRSSSSGRSLRSTAAPTCRCASRWARRRRRR